MAILRRIVSKIPSVILVLALALIPSYSYSYDSPYVRESNPHERGQSQQPPRKQRESTRASSQRDGARKARKAQRLSPEERHQLRRDIKDAEREIYAPRQQ